MLLKNLLNCRECRTQNRLLREEIRKERELKLLQLREADELNQRILTEERLLLIAQRQLESVRILSELLSRVKVIQTHFKCYKFIRACMRVCDVDVPLLNCSLHSF